MQVGIWTSDSHMGQNEIAMRINEVARSSTPVPAIELNPPENQVTVGNK